jgi:prepilin-type N-terminal cleavage/methylation domain-containing protein
MSPQSEIVASTRLRHTHRGMTLIELMVVLVILSILSSLMLAGLLGARERSKQVKTVSTIRKLSELILPYYEEYETRRPDLDPTAVSRIAADGSKANRELLATYKRIALRRLMALELPDRTVDVDISPFPLDLDGKGTPLVEIPPVTRLYKALIGVNSGVQSSDLLHMIVTRGVVADPDIVMHFRDDEVADQNGNGLKEFIDGWGKPIRFKRWPVGFASPLQPITASLSDVDPLVSTNGHRLLPLIYSAGRDKSYDIANNLDDVNVNRPCRDFNYEPFAMRNPSDRAPIAGEVYLVPSVIPVPNTGANVEVFAAERYSGGELPTTAFWTYGSARDQSSPDDDTPNGVLESADNIHNHDLRQ